MAFGELLFATMIWGFSFTAVVWILKAMDVFTMSIVRFGFAFVFSVLIAAFIPVLRRDLNWRTFLLASGPGFFLGLTLIFQTWGLESTSVTNSGFLTTLYVVLIPLLETLVFRARPYPLHYLWVTVALVGTGLMVNFHSAQLNRGDIYTLMCAGFAAIQIIWIGKISKRINSAFVFNAFQCFWALVATLIFLPFYDRFYFYPLDARAVFAIVLVTLGSTVLAFALQVKVQKVLSPALASLIFLLESPFAMLFAFWLLNEQMSFQKICGASLIFLAAVGATLTEHRRDFNA